MQKHRAGKMRGQGMGLAKKYRYLAGAMIAFSLATPIAAYAMGPGEIMVQREWLRNHLDASFEAFTL